MSRQLQRTKLEKKLLLLKKKGGYYLRKLGLITGLTGGHTDYAKYIILCAPRTGSNLLRSLLNSHSRIIAFGEVYRNKHHIGWDLPGYFQTKKILAVFQTDPVGFLKTKMFKKFPKGISAVGFKLLYQQAQKSTWKSLWQFLKNDNELRIIHLKRKNILKTHLSYLKADQSGIWVNSSGTKEKIVPVTMEYEDCLKAFQQVRSAEIYFDNCFKDHQKIDVWYENLCSNHQIEMRRVQSFLETDHENLFPSTLKQSYQGLSKAIANYWELKRKFMGTQWEGFFEE
jgi:LPS sulfotransferase NodH